MTLPSSQSQKIQQILASRPIFTDAIIAGKVTLRRYDSNPPRYELFWPEVGKNVPVSVKDDEMLFSCTRIQRAIYGRWKTVIQEMEKKEWHKCITILNATLEEVEAPGASPADSFRDLLEQWTGLCIPGRWAISDLNHRPLHKDGYYYFKTAAFESHALFIQHSRYQYHRQEMDRSTIYQTLREIGAVSTTARFKKNVFRVWRISEDFNKPTEPVDIVLIPDDDDEGDKPKGEKQGELIPNNDKDIPGDF